MQTVAVVITMGNSVGKALSVVRPRANYSDPQVSVMLIVWYCRVECNT